MNVRGSVVVVLPQVEHVRTAGLALAVPTVAAIASGKPDGLLLAILAAASALAIAMASAPEPFAHTVFRRATRRALSDEIEDAAIDLTGLLRKRHLTSEQPIPGPEDEWGRNGGFDGDVTYQYETLSLFHAEHRAVIAKLYRLAQRADAIEAPFRPLITRPERVEQLWQLVRELNAVVVELDDTKKPQ